MDTIKAILTGHTRGLGAALAHLMRSRGIAVLGVSRTSSNTSASRLLQEVELDLANPAALSEWLGTETLARFIDGAHTVLLINNAGMLQPVGGIEGQDVRDRACGEPERGGSADVGSGSGGSKSSGL
jgi:short-subunit dehydrogenase